MWHDELRNRDVIVASPQPWSPYWVSKHWIAHELSRYNRVLFVEPPVHVGGLARRPWSDRKEWKRLLRRPRRVHPNLHALAPLLAPSWLDYPDEVAQVEQAMGRLEFRNPLLLNFTVNTGYARRLPVSTKVYYCVDPFPAAQESVVCRSSDLLYATSESYREKFAGYDCAAPFEVIPHGFPAAEARRVLEDESVVRPPELRGLQGRICGYVGSIHDAYVDVSRLETVA
ncbi:MAG: hypothetical protein N2C14_29620, partial [Planctomycetales bacterium]